MKEKWILLLLCFFAYSNVFANGFNLHVGAGAGWGSVGNTDALFLNPVVENSYATSSTTKSYPLVNIGGGYRWESLFSQLPQLDVDLGVSALYTYFSVTGVNSPFVNAGQFDTLNFQADDNTYSLLIEPKLIYTGYFFQPYLIGGIGVAWNMLSSYSESPTNPASSAAPMPQPFRSKTLTCFAYEIGFGLQKLLIKTNENNNLNLFLDYRYMNLGKLQAATSPIQTTSNAPNFGILTTQTLTLGLEYQFI